MLITIDTKWVESIADFDMETKVILYEAIFAYMSDNEVNLPDDTWKMFHIIMPMLAEEKNKRLRLAERSRLNGMKGGRKKKKNPVEPKKPTRFLDYLEDPKFQNRCEHLVSLDDWKKRNTPYIYENIRPLTQREFECLEKNYSSTQICDTLRQIENRKDLRKRYTDPYRTLLNWLKKSDGRTGTNNG